MKESEAKTKWCHHVANATIQTFILSSNIVASITVNNPSEAISSEAVAKSHKAALADIMEDGMSSCKGSACMMWEAEYDRVEREIDHDFRDKKSILNLLKKGEHLGRYNLQSRTVMDQANASKNHSKTGTATIVSYEKNGSGDCGLKTKELYCNVS